MKFFKNSYFIYDYYRMTGFPYKKHCIILNHNLKFMYLFRKYQLNKNIFTRIRLYRLTKKYSLEISVDAKIGKVFYLGHPYNITIGNEVVIGNNVFIRIHATVVGNIKIGNDVLIVPNAYVNFDVPSHSVVIGNPRVIHQKNNATKGYIGFKV